jgi:hypothetical protein
MTKDKKIAIPAWVWARVQKDSSISVRQYNRASPGGYQSVEETATCLPDSGITKDGVSRPTLITAFMVNDFKDNVLLLSGKSASTAKNVQESTNPR